MKNRQCPRCHKITTSDESCVGCTLIRCGYTILDETYCVIYSHTYLTYKRWTSQGFNESHYNPLIARIDDCYNCQVYQKSKYVDEFFNYPIDSAEQAKEVINTPEFKRQELAWKMK